jgi:hypothetical protein
MRFSASLATFMVTGFVVGGAACGSSSGPKASGGTTTGAGGTTGSTTSSTTGTTSTTASTSSTTGGTGTGGTTTAGCTEPIDGGSGTGPFPFPKVSFGAFGPGGTLIKAPHIVSVTFPGDSMASELNQFGASITSTCYWDAIRAGYCSGTSASTCIGDGPAGTAVALTSPPAASYTDSDQGGPSSLQTFLSGLISAKTLPEPDDNTIYALYFPVSTSISLDGAKSCHVFDGYHNSMTVGSVNVAYAVIPECPAEAGSLPATTLENTTITGSHEFVEAASDTNSGFYLNLQDEATWAWNDIQGGEIGDLCVDPFGLGLDEVTEGGFTVQRIWSVDNAAAGRNPCVPIPAGEVYFNTYTANSVLVMDVGASVTINLTAFADGTMPAWTVLPEDWTESQTQYLSFSIAGGTNTDAGPEIQMSSGDTVQLTVTLLADPSNENDGVVVGEADGVIVSANGNEQTATAAHWWPFAVVTTAAAADAGVTMMKQTGQHGRKVSHPRGRHHSLFGAMR